MRTSVGELNGPDWESLCQKVLRLMYVNDGYHEVPARYGGDLGIEGYTQTGIVFQCYCPEGNPTDKELYEHQRDKVTRDIAKLKKNRHKIYEMIGSSTIRQWHFLTPAYSSRHLLSHCATKALKIKNIGCHTIDSNFSICIKVEEDYTAQISEIVNHTGFSISASLDPVDATAIESWNDANSEHASTIRSKLEKAVPGHPRMELLVYNNISQYLTGQRELERIRSQFPDHYESIVRLKRQQDVLLEMNSVTTSLPPGDLLKETLDDYKNDLNRLLAGSADIPTVGLLANEAIADWLIRCPLDF
ncbi:hypothetical protein [Rubrivirga sp. SAORIC476]|uniref:hypothetical protein n=1 Tax=Rubrivirga sp. SAORIC476 TaxID=1961794 RepID=UPI00117A7E0D|nr:hypothetical protein [Rubrivirga sp. SAORIC476]